MTPTPASLADGLGPALATWELGVPGATAVAVAVAVAIAVTLLEVRAEGTPRRRAVRTVLRTLVLGCVLAALAGAARTTTTSRPGTVVLLADDASGATPEGRAALDALTARARAAAARTGATLKVLPFAAAAHAPHDGSATAGVADDRPRSRLAPALAAAALAAPADAPAAVVVATDARLDLADATDARDGLDARAVRVRGVIVPPATPPARAPATRIDAFDVPLEARGPVAVRVAVTTEATVAVRLRVDGADRAQRPVAPPTAEVTFDDVLLTPGRHEVAVVVEDATGAALAVRRTLVHVAAPTRALVLSDVADGGAVRRALTTQGLEVVVAAGADAADALARERADLVVLDADVATTGRDAAAALAARVEAGTGLLVVAGRDAAAWAALAEGPLGARLPFRPAPPPTPPPPTPAPPTPPETAPEPDPEPPPPGPGFRAERRPEDALPITLLLVIDRSGSMAAERKLTLAIAAAEEAAAQLAASDRVGVVTFADEATVDLPPRAAGLVAVRSLALGLVADGNTDIYRALKAAQAVMRAETNPIRHVILLTDGRDTKSDVYGALPGELAAEKITLTTVGLGYSIDERSLKELARLAGGVFRYAPTARELPRILTRDTQVVLNARGEAAERARLDPRAKEPPTLPLPPKPAPPALPPPKPTPPKPPAPPPPGADRRPLLRLRPHDAVAGLVSADLPVVGPPRPGTVAPGAAVLLARDDDGPALVAGRAGLGRVLVWAVPADDAGVLGWRLHPRLFAQAARAVASLPTPPDAAEVRVVPSATGDRVVVALPEGVAPEAAAAALGVSVLGPDGPRQATPDGVEGGEVRFLLPATATPTAVVRVTVRRPDGTVAALPPLTYVPSPPPGPPPADVDGLAGALGAPAASPDAPDLFDVPSVATTTRESGVPALLLLALFLLPLDAWAHRRGASTPTAAPAPRPAASPGRP